MWHICIWYLYISAYFILKRPQKESTSLIPILQMRKLKLRTHGSITEREVEVGWGQSSHPTSGVALNKWLLLSQPRFPPQSNGGRARTPASLKEGGVQTPECLLLPKLHLVPSPCSGVPGTVEAWDTQSRWTLSERQAVGAPSWELPQSLWGPESPSHPSISSGAQTPAVREQQTLNANSGAVGRGAAFCRGDPTSQDNDLWLLFNEKHVCIQAEIILSAVNYHLLNKCVPRLQV